MSDKDILALKLLTDCFKSFDTTIPPYDENVISTYMWYAELVSAAECCIDKLERLYNLVAVCEQGCSSCCHHPILVWRIEAKVISCHLEKSLSAHQKYHLKKKISGICRRLHKEVLDIIEPDNEVAFKIRYFAANISCPLLDDTRKCLAYPVRPISCLTYKAYGNPGDCNSSIIFNSGRRWEGVERIMTKCIFTRTGNTGNLSIAYLPTALLKLL